MVYIDIVFLPKLLLGRDPTGIFGWLVGWPAGRRPTKKFFSTMDWTILIYIYDARSRPRPRRRIPTNTVVRV